MFVDTESSVRCFFRSPVFVIQGVPSGNLLLLHLSCLSILGCCLECRVSAELKDKHLHTGLGGVCGVLQGVVGTGLNEVCCMLEMW